MTAHSIRQAEAGLESYQQALPPFPDEVTTYILGKLELPDLHAFAVTSRAAVKVRHVVWIDWAKRFGYTPHSNGHHEYLRNLFSTVRRSAEYDDFPRYWLAKKEVKFRQGKPTKEVLDGYQIAMNILAAPAEELAAFFIKQWVYDHPTLLALAKQSQSFSLDQATNNIRFTCDALVPAAKAGDVEVIRWLYDWGVDLDQEDMYAPAPIHAAARAGHSAAIRALASYGVLVDAIWHQVITRTSRNVTTSTTTTEYYHYYYTPLELAIKKGSASAVGALLDANANPNKTGSNDNPIPFIQSCSKGQEDIVQIFLNKVPECDVNQGLRTLFMKSDHLQAIPCAKLLLRAGANPNQINLKGKTLLHATVQNGKVS